MRLRAASTALAVLAGAAVLCAPISPASAQSVECEATFLVYNNRPELNLLWVELTNDSTFFDPAELLGYRARREVRLEWRCSPFDQPCDDEQVPQQTADYRFLDGAGHLLTSSIPGGFPEPLLQISVDREDTDPGSFDIRVTNALDSRGDDVLPVPLICFAGTVCPGSDVGASGNAPLNCGDPTNDGRVSASDALAALFDATELPEMGCMGALHVCDTDDSGAITVTDALRLLKIATEQPETLACPLPESCDS